MTTSYAAVRPMADYHQIYLAPAEHTPTFDAARADVLVQVGVDGVGLIVVTGVAMGPVEMVVELLAGAPGDDPDASVGLPWEDVQEGRTMVDGPLYLTAPTVDSGVAGEVVSPAVAGWHAVRVEARGRHDHVDEFVDEPVEAYRLRFWPVT